MATAGKTGLCCCSTGLCKKPDTFLRVAWERSFFFLPYNYSGPDLFYTGTFYRKEVTDYTFTYNAGARTGQTVLHYSRMFPGRTKEVSITSSCEGVVFSRTLSDFTTDGLYIDYYNPSVYSGITCVTTTSDCVECVSGGARLRYGSIPGVETVVSTTATVKTYVKKVGATIVGTRVTTLSESFTNDDVIADGMAIANMVDLRLFPTDVTYGPFTYHLESSRTNSDCYNLAPVTGKCGLSIFPNSSGTPSTWPLFTGTTGSRYGLNVFPVVCVEADDGFFYCSASAVVPPNPSSLAFPVAGMVYQDLNGGSIVIGKSAYAFPDTICSVTFPQTLDLIVSGGSGYMVMCGATGGDVQQPVCGTFTPESGILYFDVPANTSIIYNCDPFISGCSATACNCT